MKCNALSWSVFSFYILSVSTYTHPFLHPSKSSAVSCLSVSVQLSAAVQSVYVGYPTCRISLATLTFLKGLAVGFSLGVFESEPCETRKRQQAEAFMCLTAALLSQSRSDFILKGPIVSSKDCEIVTC